MYQGVHYPSDVLVGALVGAGSAWLSYKVEKWMDKKHKKNKI
jgi:undecaprenyl-diphosphatase